MARTCALCPLGLCRQMWFLKDEVFTYVFCLVLYLMNLSANIACNCEIFTCLRQDRMLRRLWSMCLIRSIPYVHKLFNVCRQHIPLCWLNVDSTLLVDLVSSETSRRVTNNIPSRKLTCLTFFPVPDEVSVGSSQAEQNSYLKEKKQYFLLLASIWVLMAQEGRFTFPQISYPSVVAVAGSIWHSSRK